MTRFEKLWARTEEEIPGAKIVLKKDSWFMRLIFGTLGFFVGLFGGESSWDGFTTTILNRMYVPDDFWEWSPDDQYRLLRHELVHMRQFRRWPMWGLDQNYLWLLNALCMGFCYLLVLPVVFTFRAKFEKAGYTQSMLAHYELYGFSTTYKIRTIARMGRTFGSSTYLFMGRTEEAKQWARETLAKIEDGLIFNDRDNVDLWEKGEAWE